MMSLRYFAKLVFRESGVIRIVLSKAAILIDLLQSFENFTSVNVVNLWCDVIMGIRTRCALEIFDLLILVLDILVLLLYLRLQVLDLLASFVELSGLVIQVLLFLGKSILDFLHLCIGESNLLIGNLEIILAVKDGLKVEEFFSSC